MALRLIDLLIMIATVSISIPGASWLVEHFLGSTQRPIGSALAWALSVAGILITTSGVYRVFKLFPLMLPICPHCGKRPAGYFTQAGPHWPHWQVKCGACEGETELLLATERPATCPHAGKPQLRLCWPWFVGIWAPVK